MCQHCWWHGWKNTNLEKGHRPTPPPPSPPKKKQKQKQQIKTKQTKNKKIMAKMLNICFWSRRYIISAQWLQMGGRTAILSFGQPEKHKFGRHWVLVLASCKDSSNLDQRLQRSKFSANQRPARLSMFPDRSEKHHYQIEWRWVPVKLRQILFSGCTEKG